MPVSDYFSPDYATARERFCAAAERAGAAQQSYWLEQQRGPGGERLSVDVARLGPASATRALVILSGTHGVEGLCGSGCQVGYLSDQLYRALPADSCALLVHALNPYGFAWLRRVNEDNVDLNRNFIDFSVPPPSSAAYEPLHPWLVPQEWDGEARQMADRKLMEYAERHGLRKFQADVSSGQYTCPDGLFYGGRERTWSARTLVRLLSAHLPSARRVIALDLHTGLGPPAYGEPILIPRDAEDVKRAQTWFGPEVKDLAAGQSASAVLRGTLAAGFAAALPGAELTFIGLEFGTRPVLEVLTALRADHWLHARRLQDERRSAIVQQMRAAFYVDAPDWQAAVYGRAADFVYRACRGLSSA
jgi:hypothetical protein